MFVIVDEREIVTSGYTSRFKREGVSSTGFCPDEFREWVGSVAEPDLGAIEAFLLGACKAREKIFVDSAEQVFRAMRFVIFPHPRPLSRRGELYT